MMVPRITALALAVALQAAAVAAFVTSPSKVLRAAPGAQQQGGAASTLSRSPARARAGANVSMRAGRPKIAFIQTGGTIDKDYPRSTLGYAFEIADAASERVIADASHVPLGIDVDFHTACRKVKPPPSRRPAAPMRARACPLRGRLAAATDAGCVRGRALPHDPC